MAFFAIPNSTNVGYGGTSQPIGSTYKSQVLMFNSSAATNASTIVGNGGTTAVSGLYRQCKWNDFLVGTTGSPADNEIDFDVAMITAISSTYVSATLSSASSAFMLNVGVDPGFTPWAAANSSAETGITANSEKWYFGLNQRASYRWIANPGQELILPSNSQATGNNGLDMRARSAAFTGNVTVTVNGWEV
jgi:hypothetical protein